MISTPFHPAASPPLVMLGPTRPLPHVGAKARIRHFGGEVELGVISSIREGGRRVQVSCESGELVEFTLSPATAKFVLADSAHGADMELLDDRSA